MCSAGAEDPAIVQRIITMDTGGISFCLSSKTGNRKPRNRPKVYFRHTARVLIIAEASTTTCCTWVVTTCFILGLGGAHHVARPGAIQLLLFPTCAVYRSH